jgi:hypothetical protein
MCKEGDLGFGGTEIWSVDAHWVGISNTPNTYQRGGNTLLHPGSFWDVGTGSVWELVSACGTAGVSGDFSGHLALGEKITDSGGTCTWINIGQSYLINPQFGVFSGNFTPSLSNLPWSKQGAGGGTLGVPYLSQLKANSGSPSYNWSGCSGGNGSLTGVCNGFQIGQSTLVTGSGTGPVYPTSGTLGTATCPQSTPACTSVEGVNLYVQVAWVTPNGPAPALREIVPGSQLISNQALLVTPPSNVPPNAIGFLVYVGFGNLQSANEQLQIPDGITGICGNGAASNYVSNLPYGRVCQIGTTFTLTDAQTKLNSRYNLNNGRAPTHNMSEFGIVAGGSPLLSPWNGQAYFSTFQNFKIEMSKTGSQGEPFSWGFINFGAGEGTFLDDVNIGDALSGGTYYFGTIAQNSWMNYVKTIGVISDYYIGGLFEDMTAFHSVLNGSIAPVDNSQWLARSGYYFMANLASSLSIAQMGKIDNAQTEAVLEGITVENVGVQAGPHYGRGGGCSGVPSIPCRSAVYGLHIGPNVPSITAQQIWNAGQGANIQDDVCDPVNPASTVNASATAIYLRDADTLGNPSCRFVLNSDPGAKYSSLALQPYLSTTPTSLASGTAGGIPPSTGTTMLLVGLNTPVAIGPLSKINFYLPSTDSSGLNSYDICLYNSQGLEVAHYHGTGNTGTFGGSAGKRQNLDLTLPTGSNGIIPAGKYYVGWTGSAAAATISGNFGAATQNVLYYNNSFSNMPGGGTCQTNITPPTPDVLDVQNVPALYFH